jgi:hypothetical protein
MKTILIIPITMLFFIIPNFSWAQFISVSGYVNDGNNGNGLENVSIFESNSGIGTISNQNGFYKLLLQKGSINLKFSNDGFQNYSTIIDLKSDTTLLVKLKPSINNKLRLKKSDELHADVKADKKSNTRRGFKVN